VWRSSWWPRQRTAEIAPASRPVEAGITRTIIGALPTGVVSIGPMVRRSNGFSRRLDRPHPTLSLQSSGRAGSNRSGMPVIAWLYQRTVWQLCRPRMIVWALDAVSADAGHRCPALLPTCVIAGQGIRASFAAERAPRIRVRRLRAANLCFAEQRSGNDKRCNDRHPHHVSLPVVVLACPHVISFAEAAERRAHSRTSIDGQLSQVKRPPPTGRAVISPSAQRSLDLLA
jgi:hypothetical protein